MAVGPRAVVAKGRQLRRMMKAALSRRHALRPPANGVDVRKFPAPTRGMLNDLKVIAAKFTRFLQTADGRRLLEYNRDLATGWVDFGRVRLTDTGGGLKKVPPNWVAFRPVYRLLVAAARDRRYPLKQLRGMLMDQEPGPLDGDTPPPDPEHAGGRLVTPESP